MQLRIAVGSCRHSSMVRHRLASWRAKGGRYAANASTGVKDNSWRDVDSASKDVSCNQPPDSRGPERSRNSPSSSLAGSESRRIGDSQKPIPRKWIAPNRPAAYSEKVASGRTQTFPRKGGPRGHESDGFLALLRQIRDDAKSSKINARGSILSDGSAVRFQIYFLRTIMSFSFSPPSSCFRL